MRNRARQARGRDRGSVLVLALWAVFAAALGAAAVIAIGRVQQKLARNEAETLRKELALQSAIHVAIHGLIDRPGDWMVDGRSQSLTIGLDRISVAIADEAGKIDINVAGEDFLLDLFRSAKISDERKRGIVAAIQDWRDRDDDRRLLGSERADYAAGGYRYEPRNQPFANPEELQRVAGVTPELYRQISAAITVYSQRAAVDSRVALRDVLRLLPGKDETAIESVLRVRRMASDAAAPATHAGRTVAMRAGIPGLPVQWNAVVRLSGQRFDQIRIMAWQQTPE
jgi:general secretion pathway protein K